MKKIISCDECFAGMKDGKACSLCRGTGLMQKMIIQLEDDTIEMWCPSNLSQEEAQKEFDDGIALLGKNLGLSN